MAGKVLETMIRIAGQVESSLKKSIKDVCSQMDRMQDVVKEAATSTDKLGLTINDQSEALKIAKKRYMDYVLSGEEASDEAKKLASKIQMLSGWLKENQNRMKAAEAATNKLTGGLDDMGDEAKDAENGLSRLDITLGNLAANGISALLDKAGDAMSSIYGLAESTREYREDMGKLETAWESAGRSTELATSTYKQFYSVLGEEDRSVEAVNHLAKFVETEADMKKWTDICTGVWGTFGDSLPIEGLTEASNETAKVGKVTGVLADALNWAGVNEDKFNEALEGMNSEQERAAYITDTLNNLYSKAADKYRENNASIIEARNAQSDLNDKLATMGETIEPVTTAVQLSFGKILDKALEVAERIDFSAAADKIIELTDSAIDLADNGFGWVKDNAEWLIPVVSGLTAAFAAYQAISLGVATVEAIKSAVIASGTATVTAASVATWALNGAMTVLTSPIFLVAAAIGGLVAAGILLYRNWDTIKEKAAWLVDGLQKIFSVGFNILKDIMLKPFEPVLKIIETVSSAAGGLLSKIGGIGTAGFTGNLPTFATGGFTRGISIAGEAATEAVISFDPAYRSQNLSYWAKAGRMLNADFSDFFLTGRSGGSYYDMGGVTFAPNITVHGQADRESIMEAIEAEYPEFIDMLEEWFRGRGDPAYD